MIDEKIFREFTESSLLVQRAFDPRTIGIRNITSPLLLHLMLSDKNQSRNGEYNISDVTKKANMAMPNVTHILNDMQMAGYITRRRDGRHVYVTVTESGEEYYAECMMKTRAYITNLFKSLNEAGITDDELNAYMVTTMKIRKTQSEMAEKLKEERRGKAGHTGPGKKV